MRSPAIRVRSATWAASTAAAWPGTSSRAVAAASRHVRSAVSEPGGDPSRFLAPVPGRPDVGAGAESDQHEHERQVFADWDDRDVDPR